MPMLIEHIDAIARKKQRDVLYVTFHPPKSDDEDFWGEQHIGKMIRCVKRSATGSQNITLTGSRVPTLFNVRLTKKLTR